MLGDKKIAGFVLTVGEPTTKLAYQSVRDLNIPCILVRNVHPASEAVNVAMNRLKQYHYALQVDADLIVKKDALTRMFKLMKPKVGLVAGKIVYDPKSLLKGQAGHIKLFNMKAWRDVGGYKYEPCCDEQWVFRARQKGWQIAYCNDTCGFDIKTYTIRSILKKFHLSAIKKRSLTKNQNYLKYCFNIFVHRIKYVGKYHNLGSILALFGVLLGLAKLPLFKHKDRFP